ncbi:MAG: exodeoxyribonuclease III, partial [bacterium]|nr:exodeoxyribonuclease III [bacterium]
IKPISITYDLPGVKVGDLKDSFGDAITEGRVITMEFKEYYVVTVYTPNAKRSLERLGYRHKKWDPLFLLHIKELERKKPVIMCGDLNVAHKEIDLARPKDNKKNAGFTPEEREGADNIIEAGFIDTYRHLHPDKEGQYTWWSNFAKSRDRNIGWRIDYFFASNKLKDQIKDAYIRQDVMGSDHCPVGVIINV